MYPKVLNEQDTIDRALRGENLARYGDGELKLCYGHDCVSQPADKALARELREVLIKPAKGCLPCIPNVYATKGKKREAWNRWTEQKWLDLYDMKRTYGSSFVTRPDSAPWIDEPAYWDKIKSFWRGKHVALVAGTMRSLRPEMLMETGAKSVGFLEAPSGQKRDGAYAKIDDIEARSAKWYAEMQPSLSRGPVLLCVGPTATVLAHRLARRGVHAIDLGHIGMFMRSAGAFRYVLDDLVSPSYQAVLIEKHARAKGWGGDGAKHIEPVIELADAVHAETILDYGCGRQALATVAKERGRRVLGYDPGIVGKEGMPKPCDVIVATDMLEHVERDKLQNVFGHIHSLMLKAGYFVISCRRANATLPNGMNAHLIVHDYYWWLKGIETAGFRTERYTFDPKLEELRVWVRKN